jgi:cephalosporin hydroxylase
MFPRIVSADVPGRERSGQENGAVASVDPKNPELIRRMAADKDLAEAARTAFLRSYAYRYSYNFSWLGRPVIQYPQDLLAMQEILWRVRPDIVVETGIAHGGSLVFYASILELIGGPGRVIGVDIDIRAHNRTAIEQHRLASRITLIQGSSIDDAIAAQVRSLCPPGARALVALDSNHTHEHVLAELRHYAPLVTPGSYLVVFDTIVELLPKEYFPDRPWGPGNNPMTAVREFLRGSDRFEVDHEIHDKLLFTVCPHGYLRCVKD